MADRTISHYRIVGRLGVGGMGVVYEAEDQRLPRRVALKLVAEELAHDPDATRRLRREAETVARLNHPNICIIYEIDEHDGRLFIAMECVDGLNLKAYMGRKPLETREIVDIARQIAAALEAAHDAGVVHRDIKPGNVMVGAKKVVKVLDFGLARRFVPGSADEHDLGGSTILGRPLGTVSYMAPERILQMPLDARCDLFSLGVVIYEMATGRLPFTGASPAETVTNILEREATPLTALTPSRPAALERVVARLTAKLADDRYQSAGDLQEALRQVGDQGRPAFWTRVFGRS